VLEDELKALDPNSKEATRVSIKLDIIWMCPMGALAIKAYSFMKATTYIPTSTTIPNDDMKNINIYEYW
jgi:hypothetical protein